MANYEKFIATDGIYGHIARKGAGTPGSMVVLDNVNNPVFDPGNNSFAYLVVPGEAGVKFSVMEEDGVRVSAAREAFTYDVQDITGRFTRLAVETGSCCVYVAVATDYYFPQPRLASIAKGEFRFKVAANLIIPAVVPPSFVPAFGKDFGFLLQISRTGLTSTADITVGTPLLRDADEETVQSLTSYGHANTELTETITAGTATYYIAKSNTDLDDGLVLAGLQDDATNLLIPLTLNADGEYTVKVSLVEMNTETNVLEVASRVYSSQVTEIEIEASDEAQLFTFTIDDQVGATVIDQEDGTIAITMPEDTVVTALVSDFTISDYAVLKIGSTLQVSGTTANDFTSAVTYVVTAEDETATKEYVVTVTVETGD